ncbi:unnamed protein product [Danaus chrysippus]|uniref:(African queen) hypothetical protein n=1 Tax=Danaus chrysippus TaxID=151541 RepID=A0A8J2VRA2_9NEOP|nr:unnamed protein product [Danaus chrysippus]
MHVYDRRTYYRSPKTCARTSLRFTTSLNPVSRICQVATRPTLPSLPFPSLHRYNPFANLSPILCQFGISQTIETNEGTATYTLIKMLILKPKRT